MAPAMTRPAPWPGRRAIAPRGRLQLANQPRHHTLPPGRGRTASHVRLDGADEMSAAVAPARRRSAAVDALDFGRSAGDEA